MYIKNQFFKKTKCRSRTKSTFFISSLRL